MRNTRSWLVPLVLAVIAATLPALSGPKDARDWYEVRSAHFTVVGDQRARAEQIASELELFRDVLERRGHSLKLDQPVPVLVVLAKDERSFRRFAGTVERSRDLYSGFAMLNPEQPAILINRRDVQEDAVSTAHRAYIHLVLGLDQEWSPAWFREGLAEYYRTFSVSGSTAMIGRPLRHHLQRLRQYDPLPLSELLALDDSNVAALDPERRATFTAESWLLVHQHFTAGYEGKRQLSALLEAQWRGAEPAVAVRLSHGMSIEDLQHRLRLYAGLKRHPFIGVAYAALQVDAPLVVREMTARDAYAAFARSAAQKRSTGRSSLTSNWPSVSESPL